MTCVRARARLLLCFWRLIAGRRFFISFVGILMRIFPFFHNLASLFSKIVIFLWLIGNKTSCRPIRSVIILAMNKSDSRCAVVRFCYHSYDYRPNWTPLSPITITYVWDQGINYTDCIFLTFAFPFCPFSASCCTCGACIWFLWRRTAFIF